MTAETRTTEKLAISHPEAVATSLPEDSETQSPIAETAVEAEDFMPFRFADLPPGT
jgi:hypothetical protein